MFKNYKIDISKKVLYLYLDLNTEFAKTNIKRKTNIKKEVNKYIKENKIPFKNGKIVIMAGSLILGSLLLTTSPKKNINNINHEQTQNVLILEENNTQRITNTIKVLKSKDTIKETKNIKKENISIKTTANTEAKKEIINENPNEEIKPTSTKQMISIKRKNGVILYLELEDYIKGVVAAEMPASFHIEALKAQAIASRTYALKQMQDGVILTDTTSTQVYKDDDELKQLWKENYELYNNKIKKAISETEGLIMTYEGQIINAYYHSTSNGYTENASAVFKSEPYLVSVESPLDKNVSSYERTKTYSYEEISKILNIPITPLSLIEINYNNTNHVHNIIIDNNTYNGIKFRQLLNLRSTDFFIKLNENNITITTHGYGHGVGMSQYGANEYAKIGWSYQDILTHYYTGIKISKH